MKDQWTGPHDDSSPVGDGITEMENTFTGTLREVQRRPGFIAVRDWSNTSPIKWVASFQDKYLVGHDGSASAKFSLYDITLGTYADIGASNWAVPVSATTALNRLYYVDSTGTANVIRNSTIIRAMGTSAPTAGTIALAASSGTQTPGVHLLRYRKKITEDGIVRYSDPSPATEIEHRQAVIALTITSGAISASIVDGGAGYYSATIAITGDGSSGAITPTMSGGKITSLAVTAGSGYTNATFAVSAPNARITVAAQADCYVEITLANGTIYYEYADVSTALTMDVNDDITISRTPMSIYAGPDGFGHAVPPTTCKLIHEHRGRIFMWNGTPADMLYWSRAGSVESFKPTEWARRILPNGGDVPTAIFSVYDDVYLATLRGMRRLVYVSDPANGMIVQIPSAIGCWNQDCIINAEGRIFGFGPTGAWEIRGIKPNLIGHVLDNQWRPICDFDLTKQLAFGYYDQTNRRVVWHYVQTGDTECKVGVGMDLESGLFYMLSTDLPLLKSAVATENNQATTFLVGADSTWVSGNANLWYVGATNTCEAVTRILSDWNPGGPDVSRRSTTYLHLEFVPSGTFPTIQVRFYSDGIATPDTLITPELANATPNNGVSYNLAEPDRVTVTPVGGYAVIPTPSDWNRFVRFEILVPAAVTELHLLDARFSWDQGKKAKSGSEA